MNMMTDGHTVKRFNCEMNHLHSLVLLMGDMVKDQLLNAAESLQVEDLDLAQAVIIRDDEVNELDIQVSDEIVHMIAKRQPVARDLREILTVGKIVTDLERVGDEARKIAKMTITLYGGQSSAPNAQLKCDILKMVGFIDDMLEMAMQAFDRPDMDMALEVIRMNDELDGDFKSALRRLSTFIMEDSRSVGHVVETVLALRAMERIGGHAKNIAGYVLFLVKGVDVRHDSIDVVVEEMQT